MGLTVCSFSAEVPEGSGCISGVGGKHGLGNGLSSVGVKWYNEDHGWMIAVTLLNLLAK